MRVLSPCLLLATALLAGCATPPPASDPEALADFRQTNDPLEPANRVFYAINDGIDAVVLRPLAVGYNYAVPEVIRTHVHNVLVNMDNPMLLANDMMEGQPRRAGDTLMRLLINTTIGIGGIFDVASGLGYAGHDGDFGVTLAVWGVPSGPFLYLPILGPTDPRDAIGYGVDFALDPQTWLVTSGPGLDLEYARYGLYLIDIRSSLLEDLDKVKEQALDPYATFRSLYRQHRQAEINAVVNDHRATTPAWYDTPASHCPPESNGTQTC